MPINPEAHKETRLWHQSQPVESKINLSVCPRDLADDESATQLAVSKPEFYGRIGQLIAQGYHRSVSSRPQRGDIGFVNWVHEPITSRDISNWDELEHAFYTTLSVDLRDYIQEIQQFAEPDEEVAQAMFDDYLALYALLRHRVGLKRYGFADTWLSLQAGVGTATSHIAKLAPNVYATAKGDIATTVKSHKPLLRLAAMGIDQLMYFDEAYLGNPKAQNYLAVTRRGTIDFSQEVIDDIGQHKNSHEPTIGCPILLTKDATKTLWQWGVTSAQKSGLFTTEPYR